MANRAEFTAGGEVPLYRQLEESFIAEIVAGRLKPGDAVPSTYSLADRFGISRVTAVRCYEELKGRGILTARRGGSTIVNPALGGADGMRQFGLAGPIETFLEEDTQSPFDNCLGGLLQSPPLECVPVKGWLKTLQSIVDAGLPDFSKADDKVLPRLRGAITAFLSRNRGMSLFPNNVLIFDSKWQALSFVEKHLLPVGAAVAVENPCDPLLIDVFSRGAAQRDIHLLPVDREGACVEQLQPNSDIRLIAISPSAQNPTGVIMSERRRQQIALFAGRSESLLLEDDGLALLRFGKQPEPCLFNKFKDSLHIGSFGAYLGPLCQLSYLIIPNHLMEKFEHVLDARSCSQPRLEHMVLVRMLECGVLEQAIARMRTSLARYRQDLLSIVGSEFREIFSVNAGAAGYDIVIRFQSRFQRDQVLNAVDSCGLKSRLLAHCYLENDENRRIELRLPLCEKVDGKCGERSTLDRLFELRRMLLSEDIPMQSKTACESMQETLQFEPPEQTAKLEQSQPLLPTVWGVSEVPTHLAHA